MKRWYEKSTGIVLKIETSITRDSEYVSVLEVLNATNIIELSPVGTGPNSTLLVGIAGGSFCAALGLLVLYRRKRNRNSTLV
jgi:LPXTG-motif cell wall-anchored protein